MATGIEQLVNLLKNNPDIAKQIASMVDIDSVLDLVKSKGVEIAKNELQEYLSKNVDLGDIAGTLLKSGAATSILGSLFGGKK